MKTNASILLIAALLSGACLAVGQEQAEDVRQEPLPEISRQQVESAVEKQSVLLDRLFGVNVQTGGVVPMALKSRQPWQLINPLAPLEYGDGFDNTTRDPQSGRVKGISIFGVKF